MNTYIILFFTVIATAFLVSCGDDTTITNTTNPPTAADSTIKLYSPLDSSHYNDGDSIHNTWSKGLGAYMYRLYSDSSDAFLQNNYGVYSDTSISGLLAFSQPQKTFIKIVPIINDTARFQYQSDTHLIFFNQ